MNRKPSAIRTGWVCSRWLMAAGVFVLAALLVRAEVIISEIMYHPLGEDDREEFVELLNHSDEAVSMKGWSLGPGVRFEFPDVMVRAGGRVVVAADLGVFSKRYPEAELVVGNWAGRLSNGGERLELRDARGVLRSWVEYSDDGDWAERILGAIDHGHRGWEWFTLADGGGRSLELINPALDNRVGANWAPSRVEGGTPGRVNSVARVDNAPLLSEVRHFPAIPRSIDRVIVRARVRDERLEGVAVWLHYRIDGESEFRLAAMLDDGVHGDLRPGDGVFGASLDPFSHRSVVEFFVSAKDAGGLVRYWPPPALADGVATQTANALFQVDDTPIDSSMPEHRIILTARESALLRQINFPFSAPPPYPGVGQSASHAQFNATFVGVDGAGVAVRYRVGVRNRGNGSQARQPQSFRINFRRDDRWKGIEALNLNGQNPHLQVLASALYQHAGMVAQDARPSRVKWNGVSVAVAGAPSYGFHAASEVINSDFARHHFPLDDAGNVYRGVRLDQLGGANLRYQGEHPDPYRTNYFKQTNTSVDDWSDLIQLTRTLQGGSEESYASRVRQVLDVEAWMTYFAVETLLDNKETNLANANNGTGPGDDYFLYRGEHDRRFRVIPYDLDTILGGGDTPGLVTDDLFRMNANPTIARFMRHPEFAPVYYAALERLLTNTFSPSNLTQLVERHLGGMVPRGVVDALLKFNEERTVYVRSRIPKSVQVGTVFPVKAGYSHTTSSQVDLVGTAPAAATAELRVNGRLAKWTPIDARWEAGAVQLVPGINTVLIQSFDGSGKQHGQQLLELWAEFGAGTSVMGLLPERANWKSDSGPYRLAGVVTVPSVSTLVIEPGTTVYLEAGARLEVQGQLLAEGRPEARIRFTRPPESAGNWGGLFFRNSTQPNRVRYVDFEYGGASGQFIRADYSDLEVEHSNFKNANAKYLELQFSSFRIANNSFPALLNAELIHGEGIPAGGRAVIEGNVFGGTTGLNDIIDFSGGKRPGPILEVRDNLFTSASDDVLDLDGADALVEGNTFVHAHQTVSDVDTSSAVSGGMHLGLSSEIMIVRNFFWDCDHIALAKEGNYYTLLHNTAVAMTKSGIQFDEPGRRSTGVFPGRGAYLEANLLWQTSTNFEDVQVGHPIYGTTDLVYHGNLLSGMDLGAGTQNILRVDPRFVVSRLDTIPPAELNQALALRPDSPVRGLGAEGLDWGAAIPGGLRLTGGPVGTTWKTTARFLVTGPGWTEYRCRLDEGLWSESKPIHTPVQLEGLGPGSHRIRVLGRNWAGRWMREGDAVVSQEWMVDPAAGRLRLSEVAAGGDGAGDFVEIYNDSAGPIDLGAWGLTQDAMVPGQLRFPSGLVLASEQYLTVGRGEGVEQGKVRLPFGIDLQGDQLYLFRFEDGGAHEVDRVEFGNQLRGFSVGLDERGHWVLSRPSPGRANVPVNIGGAAEVKINEWRAGADNGFVELFNPLGVPVDLGGHALSDAPVGDSRRMVFRPLTFIGAHSSMAFGSSSSGIKGVNELPFELPFAGSQVALFGADGRRIDWISYGAQRPGVSQGRTPDGSERWSFFDQPTPGGGNPMIRIHSTAASLLAGLVALTNVWSYETRGVDLAPEWRLTDYDDRLWPANAGVFYANTSTPPPSAGAAIPGLGSAAYFRTHFLVPDSLTNASLQMEVLVDDGMVAYLNGVEVLRLGMPEGAIIGSTPSNRRVTQWNLEGPFVIPSQALRPGNNVMAVEVHQAAGGTADLVFGMALTARKDSEPVLAAATQVVMNEVYAAPGLEPGWVEIHNPSNGTLDLSGLSLSDDSARPRRWVVPSGRKLGPGGYWVIQCDGNLPASDRNTGFGLKSSGGVVLLFDKPDEGGALLDSIRYGLQTIGFSLSRVPNGSGTWKLGALTPGEINVEAKLGEPSGLRINEWMASPVTGSDWIELFNPSSFPVELSGFAMSDDAARPQLSTLPALSFIGVGTNGFVRFDADDEPDKGGDHLAFRLSSSGETLTLVDASGAVIETVVFGAQKQGVSQGRVPDGGPSIISFPGSGTPAASNFQLPPVLINEVLTHTDPPLEDAVEIYNPTTTSLSIGGWYLSDSEQDLKKFRIPAGTVIPAGGYTVIYEHAFNGGTGSSTAFTLNSAHGDEVYLSAADAAGNLTGFRAIASFGSSPNGVSFARYPTSVGFEFVASSRLSFGSDDAVTLQQFRLGQGASNAPPLIGPVVISEMMYQPVEAGGVDNTVDEYVELWNLSTAPALLYDPMNDVNSWRIKGGIEFTFPSQILLGAGEVVLLVNFDPVASVSVADAFRAKFQIPAGVRLFGPYAGKLGNTGDEVGLFKPDPPQLPPHPDAGFVPYVLVERLNYLPTAPWPAGANGTGNSLNRVSVSGLANEPANWTVAAPTPGRAGGSSPPADSDLDGLPDVWEQEHGLDARNPGDATTDLDEDGLTALQEYRLGTNPRSAASALRVETVGIEAGQVVLRIRVGVGGGVMLESADTATGPWVEAQAIPQASSESVLTIRDAVVSGREKYYRAVQKR